MASACSVYDTSHPLQICAEYPTYAESPFLALILMALDRLVQLSENPHCNRANCKMLTTYFQENMTKCLPRALGKVLCFCLSPHASHAVWCHAAFTKHYKQTLPILRRLLQLCRDMFQFFRSLSAPGWLKKVPRSKKVTQQFETFDAKIMAAIGSSSLPVIRPIHANMAVTRKYLDGTLSHTAGTV